MTGATSEKPKRKNAAVRDPARMGQVERAAPFFAGQVAMADAIGMSSGLLRQKIDGSRPMRDEDLLCIAAALSKRAEQANELAARLRALVTP